MEITEDIQNIIWDWNGTLLNDTTLCIQVINSLLSDRKLPPIDVTKYKEVFSFPVKDYYERIGFDFGKEPFEIPAKQFIDIYNVEVLNCDLHENAKFILDKFKQAGKKQFVLSAMEQKALETTLKQHQIFDYFDGVSGLDNHYAASKTQNGKVLIEKHQLDTNKTCLIGDTTHDAEVAEILGCNCILIADGHQSANRLENTGLPVLSRIDNIRMTN